MHNEFRAWYFHFLLTPCLPHTDPPATPVSKADAVTILVLGSMVERDGIERERGHQSADTMALPEYSDVSEPT
jgi:hypothetical protein